MEPPKAPFAASSIPTIVGDVQTNVSPESSNAVKQLAQRLLACRVSEGWNFSNLPDFSDRDLKEISSQPGPIKFLNFFQTKVTGNGLVDTFCVKEGCSTRLSMLKGLVLTGIPYTAGMRTFLEKLSSTAHQLTELYIGGPCAGKKGKGGKELSALFGSNSDLNTVSLNHLILSSVSLQALCQKVQELKLVNCKLMPGAFEKFDEKSIRVLSINACAGLTSGQLRAIAASDKLTELYLGFLALPQDAFEILKGCRNLNLLCLCDCQNLDGQWSHLLAFQSLKTVKFERELLNKESNEVLAQLHKRSPTFSIKWLGEVPSENETESDESENSDN
ncbi:MAG: hypothetical protein LLG04_03105 [Parachlamydia sp.]|nr:hypothetical protein [Parachlamydia sp.]